MSHVIITLYQRLSSFTLLKYIQLILLYTGLVLTIDQHLENYKMIMYSIFCKKKACHHSCG